MTVTSASMISDDPPKLVFVFVCLCVYVDMCLYVVEPSGFRVLGFFRCLRRYLSINKHVSSQHNKVNRVHRELWAVRVRLGQAA